MRENLCWEMRRFARRWRVIVTFTDDGSIYFRDFHARKTALYAVATYTMVDVLGFFTKSDGQAHEQPSP